MKLVELEPTFLSRTSDQEFREHDDIAQADGLLFLCPKCWLANKGAAGTHSVICWKPSIPQTTPPKGGRWPMTGTGYGDLSLSPSIQLPAPCQWHGWIRNGEVIA